MANISDLIENFIIKTLGEEDFLDLSRNDLAEFFGVAPSQINYVLSTRFNFERGYTTSSQRGGGGYIRLAKLDGDKAGYISSLLTNVGEQLDYQSARSILLGLLQFKQIEKSECEHMLAMLTPKALSSPIKIENTVRANIIRSLLQDLSRRSYE